VVSAEKSMRGYTIWKSLTSSSLFQMVRSAIAVRKICRGNCSSLQAVVVIIVQVGTSPVRDVSVYRMIGTSKTALMSRSIRLNAGENTNMDKYLKEIVDEQFVTLFAEVKKRYMLDSGDIDVYWVKKLNEVKDDLILLLKDFIIYNDGKGNRK